MSGLHKCAEQDCDRCVRQASESRLAALISAGTDLYLAGRWSATGVPPAVQADLWTRLRDALGIAPGTATARGDAIAPPGVGEMEEAVALVYGDRQGDYGTPRENYTGIAQVWSGLLSQILSRPITPEEAALMMVGLKLQRQAMKHKRDNLVDAHGYLTVYARIVADR